MGVSDGAVLGRTKIVDHGPDNQRYCVVVLGDGYTAAQMAQYRTDVDTIIAGMRATPPFDELWCAINVYRVEVRSTDSGADDPATCGDGSTGSGATPRTYFDASFCNDGTRRLLLVNAATALNVAKTQVPDVDFTMVVVNSMIYGGAGGEVATLSLAPGAIDIAIHEMGHTAFGLADEYEYYLGCASGETDRNNHPAIEPEEPNVTINTNAATIKWAGLLTNAADGLPTTNNANCAACDTQANPRAANYVGAYEGAHYYHCDAYRPIFNCKMRSLGGNFCPVCTQVIRNVLTPFLPAESLVLVTPSIAFTNIPEGLGGVGVTTWRAIVFEVVTCGTRTFRITAGPTGGFGTPLGTVDSVSEVDADPVAEARIWLSYTSTTAGASAAGSVTVACDETGDSWVIPIVANTVARPKAAVALVLDHSGSMSEDAGGGTTKVAKLREAANIFVAAMLDGDAVGIARFDDTADVIMAVTNVGPPTIGAGRLAATAAINGPLLDPDGATSIGGGVLAGRGALNTAQASATPPYDVLALLALTDGVENTPPWIADVSSSINANTFAIGLGLPQNISVAALSALTSGHNGYLLVTGALGPDQAARLNKYFLQILAGITNANVVLDPGGVLTPGAIHRIPFSVSEAEMGLDVFLLSPAQHLTRFALETPRGTVIDVTGGLPANVQFVPGPGLSYYRLSLPAIPADALGSHVGTWHALLALGESQVPVLRHLRAWSATTTFAVPYELVVHCYSNLMLRGAAVQDSYEPGATVSIHATLLEYDTPVEKRARMWVELTRPDSSRLNLAMPETDPGRFEVSFVAGLPGLHDMRLRATGATYDGSTFQREMTLTAVAVPGGDRPPRTQVDDPPDPLCRLVTCLLENKAVDDRLIERLRSEGLDLGALLACLERACRKEGFHAVEQTSTRKNSIGLVNIEDLAQRLQEILQR